MAAAEVGLSGTGVDVDWYTVRERDLAEVLPWDHLDSGLDKEWLWSDWQDALAEVEVDDCRWTPCFDCGVCDHMGTEIQIGPTGAVLLPLLVLPLSIPVLIFGVGAVVLGTRTGRGMLGSAARLGALALIGGLAYKAYQNYAAGRPLITGGDSQALVAAPAGSGFEPQAVSNETALLYIRAMIAAAAADGRIDENEQQKLIGSLQQAGLDDEAHAFLQQELQSPASIVSG